MTLIVPRSVIFVARHSTPSGSTDTRNPISTFWASNERRYSASPALRRTRDTLQGSAFPFSSTTGVNGSGCPARTPPPDWERQLNIRGKAGSIATDQAVFSSVTGDMATASVRVEEDASRKTPHSPARTNRSFMANTPLGPEKQKRAHAGHDGQNAGKMQDLRAANDGAADRRGVSYERNRNLRVEN